MDFVTLECANCGARHQFYLSRDDDRHLRRCPDCSRWLVARADSKAGGSAGPHGYRVESLGDPPTCPVTGCEETVPGDDLPPHIIEHHDGTLGTG